MCKSTKSQQRGLTLLETIVALSIMAMGTMLMAQLADSWATDTKNAGVADQMRRNAEASRNFIKDNYTTIASTATSTSPYLITASMLVSGGYLPTGSTGVNGYGHSVCTLVLQPSANKLQGLVVSEGGTAIDDLALGTLSSLVGSSGGGVYSTSSTTITGAMGSWSIPVATWDNLANNLGKRCDGATAGAVRVQSGHQAVALWFENSLAQSATLYRNSVPGMPQLNTVNTPIILNSTQIAGAACSPAGAVANDGTGKLINCTGGTWSSLGSTYWRDPVGTFSSLPGTDPAGTVRMTTDTGRAFMWTGGGWSALAVDQNGNLTVPGTLSAAAGRVVAWNQVTEGGVLQLVGANGQSVYLESLNGTFRLINSPWNAQLFTVDQAGNMSVAGNATVSGNTQSSTFLPNTVATAGTACSPNGLIAKDSTGAILSCQSGVWSSPGGIVPGAGNAQVWKAVAGKSVSCTTSPTGWVTYPSMTAYASVDANGNYITRVYYQGGYSAWAPAATQTAPLMATQTAPPWPR